MPNRKQAPTKAASRLTGADWRAERNRKSVARLMKALPAVFPAMVLRRALASPFVPPMPRLAVDAYWRAHPLRADRLARALAARSGAPEGWSWELSDVRSSGQARSFRQPPSPYREARFSRGKGYCCVCGQEVYRFGWHVDLWAKGRNRNAEWHSACVVAWRLWGAPSDQVRLLRRLQRRRCAGSGQRLWRNAEVDHEVPLFRVWREHRDLPWPELLRFWGLPNLQVINRDIHVAKCAVEAKSRSRAAKPAVERPDMEAGAPEPAATAPAASADGAFWPSIGHLMASLEAAAPGKARS